MSNPGMRDALASAMQKQQGQPAPAAAPGGQQQQQGNAGGLGELAQAYARCEQTKQCSPQDAQILQAGLPQLVQMAKNIQQILASTQGGQPQQGQPQPQPTR